MDLDNTNVIAILGDRHTGKTNLMIHLIDEYKGDKEKYLYGYPVEVEGYKRVNTLAELSQLTNAIIGMDELHRAVPFYHKRTNDRLLDLLSTMAHNNNTIIFSTCLSQFISKALDGFIDGFCYVKMIDLNVLKNGSKAKRRLSEFADSRINSWSLNLKIGEYLEVVDSNEIGENGLKTFKDKGIGKDFRGL